MDNLEILSLSEDQKVAVDFVAMTPGITNKDLAKAMDKCEHTISAWRKNGTFIDACYNRFIELNGTRLMSVMEAMFREAEEGSVPAAQLILKHYNKLNDTVRIEIESPWEKYLRFGDIKEAETAEIVEITPEKAKEIGSSAEIKSVLPPRNPKNDKPVIRAKNQNKRLKNIKKVGYSLDQKRKKRNANYALRVRAKKVGLEPLSHGRKSDLERKQWLNRLIEMEKEQNIKV
jgi:hypothetical protein